MKHILKYGLFSILGLFTLLGCEEDEALVLTEPEAGFELIESDFTTIVLNSSFPDNPAFTLNWSDELTGGGTYTIEMDTDALFPNPVALGTSDKESFTISVGALNSALLDAGAQPYKNFEFFVRVSNGAQSTSAVSYTVQTYVEDNPVITSPEAGSSFVLDGDNPSVAVTTVSWEDFDTQGTSVTVEYTIEAALAGTDFAEILEAGFRSNETSLTWTNEELNTLALGLGIGEEEQGSIAIRIRSEIDNGVSVLERTSQPVTFSVTTYSTALIDLFLVGDATAPGWNNNNNNPPLIRLPDNKFQYTYTARFQSGAFKMLEVRGQWQPQWGLNNGNFVSNETLGYDPDVFGVGATGYYIVTVNTKENTHSMTPYDASSAPTYGSLSIIGSATPQGWGGDTTMTQQAFDPHIWYINNVALGDGEMKFRTTGDWGTNWGSDTAVSGFGNFNGPNIPVKAGTYDIWFNDLTGGYIFVKKN